MRIRRATTGLILAAILGAACTEHRSAPMPASVDSATEAVREARRQAFLADQEARIRKGLEARRFGANLVLERPTVVAFYPSGASMSDTVALRHRLALYTAVTEKEGWLFEERHSGEFHMSDARSNAFYWVVVHRDSTGLVLAAPGYPPQVWYGEITAAALRRRLRAMRHWLPGKASARPGVL